MHRVGIEPYNRGLKAVIPLPHSPKRTQVRLKITPSVCLASPDVIRTYGWPVVQEYRLRLKRP